MNLPSAETMTKFSLGLAKDVMIIIIAQILSCLKFCQLISALSQPVLIMKKILSCFLTFALSSGLGSAVAQQPQVMYQATQAPAYSTDFLPAPSVSQSEAVSQFYQQQYGITPNQFTPRRPAAAGDIAIGTKGFADFLDSSGSSGGGGFSFGSLVDSGLATYGLGDLNFNDFDIEALQDLDLGNLNIEQVTGYVNSISGTLTGLSRLAVDAKTSLQALKDGNVEQLGFDLQTAFGTINTNELRMLARKPQLFDEWLKKQLYDRASSYTPDELEGYFGNIVALAGGASDIKQALRNGSALYNSFKGLDQSIGLLRSDFDALNKEKMRLDDEMTKNFETSLSIPTKDELRGSLVDYFTKLSKAEDKNPTLGESGDPHSSHSSNRVTTPPAVIQAKVLEALSKNNGYHGVATNGTCNGASSTGGGTTAAPLQQASASGINSFYTVRPMQATSTTTGTTTVTIDDGGPDTNATNPSAPKNGNAPPPAAPSGSSALDGGTGVFAGPLPQYRPSEYDGAMRILWRMFGDPGNLGIVSVAGGGTSPNADKMSKMFLVLNTAIAAMAAIWFAFTMGSALLQGGHDGEFLGKRYHSFWLPIRTVLGASLIVPIPLIGYSIAQVLTMLAATTGIGIANATAGFAVGVIVEATPVTSTIMQPVLSKTFHNAVSFSALCVADENRLKMEERGLYADKTKPTTTGLASQAEASNIDFGMNIDVVGSTLTVQFGAKDPNSVPNYSSYGYSKDYCGSFQFKTPKPSELSQAGYDVPVLSQRNRKLVEDGVLSLTRKQIEAFALYSKAVMDITSAYHLFESLEPNSAMSAEKARLIPITFQAINAGLDPVSSITTPSGFFAVDWTRYSLDKGAYEYFSTLAAGYYDLLVKGESDAQSANIACGSTLHVEKGPKSYGWIGLGFSGVQHISTAVYQGSKSSETKVESKSGEGKPRPSNGSCKGGGACNSTSAPAVDPKAVAQNATKIKREEELKTRACKGNAACEADYNKRINYLKSPNSVESDDEPGIFGKLGALDSLEKMASVSSIMKSVFTPGDPIKVGFYSVAEISNFGYNVLRLADELFETLFLAWGGYAVAAGLGTVAGPFATAISGFIAAIFTTISALVFAILVPLAYLGIKLCLIIPMIPVLKWIGAILDWMVIVIEAMLASPYWAMAHLDGEGEGLGRNTAHGYIFFLNLLFRPALLVIVFSLITSVLGVILGFANGMLSELLTNLVNQPDSSVFMRFVILIGALALMVSIFENMLTQAYSILSVIPDKVFTWIGGNFGSNVGGGLSENITGGAGGATQQGLGAAGSGFQQGAGAFGAGARNALSQGRAKADNNLGTQAQAGLDQASQGGAEIATADQMEKQAHSMMQDADDQNLDETARGKIRGESDRMLDISKSLRATGQQNMEAGLNKYQNAMNNAPPGLTSPQAMASARRAGAGSASSMASQGGQAASRNDSTSADTYAKVAAKIRTIVDKS